MLEPPSPQHQKLAKLSETERRSVSERESQILVRGRGSTKSGAMRRREGGRGGAGGVEEGEEVEEGAGIRDGAGAGDEPLMEGDVIPNAAVGIKRKRVKVGGVIKIRFAICERQQKMVMITRVCALCLVRGPTRCP